MLFENKTVKTVKVRIIESKKQNLYGWRNVKPNNRIELPEEYGLRMKLTSVPVEQPEESEDKNPDDPNNPEEKETDEERAHKDWMEEILAVKNVGPKRAEDIISNYPTRTSLREAVNKEEHLVMEDDVADHFIEKYTKDE